MFQNTSNIIRDIIRVPFILAARIRNKMFENIRVLFTPSVWLQINPYSEKWDHELMARLHYMRFERCDEYTAYLGDREIWIANHPYASFSPRTPIVRPRRITILKAHDKLMNDLLGE